MDNENVVKVESGLAFKLAGRFRDCWMCEDGKVYHHWEQCSNCKGSGLVKLEGAKKRTKCVVCKGTKGFYLNPPKCVGACYYCGGTRKVEFSLYENVAKEDKEWVFDNLFKFDKAYVHDRSSFNEEHLGIGIIAGVTDYGRYHKLGFEDFKLKVRDTFLTGHLQYISLQRKGYLPKEIVLNLTPEGWYAYPVY